MDAVGKTRRRYNGDVTRLLAEKFPKFTRIQLCMVNNPDYGLDLSTKAKSYLRETGYEQAKAKPARKKQNRLSARFDDPTWAEILKDYEREGSTSMQEYLEKLVQNKLKGERNA